MQFKDGIYKKKNNFVIIGELVKKNWTKCCKDMRILAIAACNNTMKVF